MMRNESARSGLLSLLLLTWSFFLSRTLPAAVAAPRTAVSGLTSEVTVRRDLRGIPYISGGSERDLFRAQGYVTAADRLWQMDLLRRTAAGELAEILGKKVLEEDRRRRIYGFSHRAASALEGMSAGYRRALEAYAEGVNTFIESSGDHLPAEFGILGYKPRRWNPSDSVLIAFLFAEDLSTSWPGDLAAGAFTDLPPRTFDILFPKWTPLDSYVIGASTRSQRSLARPDKVGSVAPDLVTVDAGLQIDRILAASRERAGMHAPELAASNNWVVSGDRTLSGKPMLANDPHLSPSAPPIWHMVHLNAPGFRVAGVTAPGVPGVLLGRNESISWGSTNLGADVQDLYRETFDPANPLRYKTPLGWAEATVRQETIRVRKDPPATGTEDVIVAVTSTRHGPIVMENASGRFALKWTMLEVPGQLETFYLFNKARNWSDFRKAMRRFPGPAQNFIYADRRGNIGYWAAGQIPVRRDGDGSVPYDGAKGEGAWTGFIPFESLPHLYNPPAGVIVTANQQVAGPDYVFELGRASVPPYRARRIRDLIGERNDLTPESFRQIQGDTYSHPDHVFAQTVAAMSDGRSENEWRELRAIFAAWDGKGSSESDALLLAGRMRAALLRRVVTHLAGAELAPRYRWPASHSIVDRLMAEKPAELLPTEFASYPDLVLASYADAKAEIEKRLGADRQKWSWGRWRDYKFSHPLAESGAEGKSFAIAPIPARAGGSTSPVNAGAGVSMRMIVDLGQPQFFRQGIATGNVGDPSGPHWDDQLADWLSVIPAVFPFSAEAVSAYTVTEMMLTP